MRSVRALLFPVLLSVLCGGALACFDSCQPPFPPGNHIDKFRILAIQAEPPEIQPGERTQVSFLAVDPKGLIKASQVFPPTQCFRSGGLPDPSAVWVACLPGIGLGKASDQSCTDVSFLQGGSDGGIGSLDAGGRSFQILLPPCGSRSFWVAPQNYLDKVPKQKQEEGGEAVFVLAALRGKVRQISLKRVRISSKKKTVRNTNPRLISLSINNQPVSSCRPEDKEKCTVLRHPIDRSLSLRVVHDALRQDPLPTVKGKKPRKEDIVIEWFATDGEFSTRQTVLSGETPPRNSPFPTWSPTDYKGQKLPLNREVQIIALARDGRGGIDWLSTRIVLIAGNGS